MAEIDWLPKMSDPDHPRLILVCGGRDYADREHVREVLAAYLPDDPAIDEPTVIHGAARGADTLAGEEAKDLGFWVGEHPADWKRHGKRAGIIRNREMLDMEPDLVIAFPGGKGTADLVAEAAKRGIAVNLENARRRTAPSQYESGEG